MNAFSRLIPLSGLVFSLLTTAPGADKKAGTPEVDKIIAASQITLQRLTTDLASWTVTYRATNDLVIQVKMVSTASRKSWSGSIQRKNVNVPSFSIRQVEGVWQVSEFGRAWKSLPYEPDLATPGAYAFIANSELKCIVSRELLASATFEKREQGKLHYRMALPAENREFLQRLLVELEVAMTDDPSLKPKLAVEGEKIRTLLHHGQLVQIDEATGILTSFIVNNTEITVSDFKWLEAIPENTFPPVGELEWQNPPIQAADLKNYVMVGRDSRLEVGRTNKFGQIKPLLSGHLLNLKTGDLRRLPFRGTLCLPGCFLSDRTEVVVSGLDPLSDMMGLFKVNLLTGENRRITPEGLGYKVMLAEDLSPDGKQLVTISAFNGASVLDFQVSVLNLKTEELKPIGKPVRIQAPVSWLPDGDGFVLSRSESDTGSVETPVNLTLMDMNGVMRDIRRGRWPVVLHKSRKILYQNEFELWYTCDLDGKNPQLFADGLRGHGIPTVSPDERQVLFVQFPKGKLPRIRLFELGKSNGKFVVHAGGLTTMPVWR